MIKKLFLILLLVACISNFGFAQVKDTLWTWPYVCQAASFPVTLSGWHGNGGNRLDSVVNAYRNDSLLLKYYFTQTVGPAVPTPFQVTVNFATPQPGIYTIYAKRFLNNSIYYSASTTTINVCAGINGLAVNETKNLEIYPNPTTGLVMLKKLPQNGVITLSDITSGTLNRQTITTSDCTFDLNQYPAGLYFLTIETTKGISVRKILKN